MKEQYIKKVLRELTLPRKKKREIERDLQEIFRTASEHGEPEEQVVERLGSPNEFAESVEAQIVPGKKGRKAWPRAVVPAAAALICFIVFGFLRLGQAPSGAIGQASAMTTIQVEAPIHFDLTAVFLFLGVAAVLVAAVQLIRGFRRRQNR